MMNWNLIKPPKIKEGWSQRMRGIGKLPEIEEELDWSLIKPPEENEKEKLDWKTIEPPKIVDDVTTPAPISLKGSVGGLGISAKGGVTLPEPKQEPFDWVESQRYHPEKISGIGKGISVFGGAITKLPKQIKAAVLQLTQKGGGAKGASVANKDWADKYIKSVQEEQEVFVDEMISKYGDISVLPGIKISDIAQMPQSMAFSATSMGAGLAVGVPTALIPLPGSRILAWGLGTIASGKAAYEMSAYQIMQTYLDVKNEEKMASTGQELTLEEENNLKQGFNNLAKQYALWEAIPEAISNLAFASILTAPLTKMVGKSIAGKIVEKLAGMYGEELLTETITQMGQKGVMKKVGLPGGEKVDWTSPTDWVKSFKEVAPQTFLLTTVMAGTGTLAINTSKVVKSLNNEVKDNVIKEKLIEKIEDKTSLKEAVTEKPAVVEAVAGVKVIYHVTTGVKGVGLGSLDPEGKSKTVSFTTDKNIAKNIQDTLILKTKIAKGDLGYQELRNIIEGKYPDGIGLFDEAFQQLESYYKDDLYKNPKYILEGLQRFEVFYENKNPDFTQVWVISPDKLKDIDIKNIKIKEANSKEGAIPWGEGKRVEGYEKEALGEPRLKEIRYLPEDIIWKAPVAGKATAVPATGEGKVSKIAASIEAKSIEQGLTKGYGHLAEYTPIVIKEQAQKATDLINNNIDEARKIIRGETPLPEGLKGTALITAMEEHIKKTADGELASELASSPLVSGTSAAAQELRLAAERDPESPVKAIADINKLLNETIKKRYPGQILNKAKTNLINNIKNEIKKANSSQSWQQFILSIRCS
ncbi:MAG: hypothetical protein ABIF11_11055 [Nitrospirota bacterium]